MERSDIKGRFELFKRACPPPDGYEWVLSAYNPGDGKRWQIELQKDGKISQCFPHHGHWKTKDFDRYLDGMLDMNDHKTRSYR